MVQNPAIRVEVVQSTEDSNKKLQISVEKEEILTSGVFSSLSRVISPSINRPIGSTFIIFLFIAALWEGSRNKGIGEAMSAVEPCVEGLAELRGSTIRKHLHSKLPIWMLIQN